MADRQLIKWEDPAKRPAAARRGAALSAALVAATLVSAGAAAQPSALTPSEVKDLYYGKALFSFFQDKYFASATEILIAVEKQRLHHHEDEAQLLLGGMYLSYGMLDEAERIFQQLISPLTTPEVANRAWFHLGEIFYRRDSIDQALRAVERISGPLSADLEPRRVLLAANIQMRQNRHDVAIKTLEGIQDDSIWSVYARYNLGIALIKLDRYEEGKRYLAAINKVAGTDPELLALRDKANLAHGYAALLRNKPDEARLAFSKVRIKGPSSNPGLFGIGQAYFVSKNYHEAINYWLELRKRSSRGPAVFESMLTVPQTYALLEVYPKAAEEYEHAITVYGEEIAQLDATIAEVQRVNLFDKMIAGDVTDELAWFWQPNALPDPLRHHYITQLFASYEFSEALKNYRDLRFYSHHLRQWLDSMASFYLMLETRRQAFNERMPRVAKEFEAAKPEAFWPRYQALAGDVVRAEEGNDPLALATASETAAMQRLADINSRLSAVEGRLDPGEYQKLQHKYRLLRGRLLWNVNENFKPRLRETKKAMASLEREVERSQQLHQSLRNAQASEPQRFEEFSQRIRAERERTEALLQAVDAARLDQEKAIQDLAISRLEQQKQRLIRYSEQAQFALAQIYDLLLERSRATPPPE